MLHARLFKETARFRDDHFQPTRESLVTTEKSSSSEWLDGNSSIDRPLFVQFCANKPDDLLEAAQFVAPYCDAVDLNLGCPQGIARSGQYGAFLQEHWDTIYSMIKKLHDELSIPITAKIRILETREKTLEYAKMVLSAGASILTVHGRRREQKGHNMGVADWSMIRYLRDNLPSETVLFANGNILNSGDISDCLEATGADGVMSAEGNLSDPTIFARPPADPTSREYWRGADGVGGYRLDGVFRRYMDIIYQYVLDREPPSRPPLYLPGDAIDSISGNDSDPNNSNEPQLSKKKKKEAGHSPSLKSMQGHLFQLLRPMLSNHTHIRDTLARCQAGDIATFEKILGMVEEAVRTGLDKDAAAIKDSQPTSATSVEEPSETTPSQETIAKYRRPWWVCQPYIRPLPEEALKLGSLTLSKKDKAKLEIEKKDIEATTNSQRLDDNKELNSSSNPTKELPKEALVCG